MLERAVRSVEAQTRPPTNVIIELDESGAGACATRNRGLSKVTTEWVAFLDDDDELLPNHLEDLGNVAAVTGADLVYPRWEGANVNLFNGLIGYAFDARLREHIRSANFIPITTLVRTKLLHDVGGFSPHPDTSPTNPCEDWGAWLKLLDAGAKFVHYPEVTWRWNGHGGHTSGRSWK